MSFRKIKTFRIFFFGFSFFGSAPPTHTLRQRSENFEFRKKTFRSPITISDHVIVVISKIIWFEKNNFKTSYFEMGQWSSKWISNVKNTRNDLDSDWTIQNWQYFLVRTCTILKTLGLPRVLYTKGSFSEIVILSTL